MGLTDSDLNVTARVNDPEAIKNLVAGGLGISIISERAARNFVQSKRLLAFELPEDFASRSLYLIYGKDYMIKSSTREFIDFLIKRFERE